MKFLIFVPAFYFTKILGGRRLRRLPLAVLFSFPLRTPHDGPHFGGKASLRSALPPQPLIFLKKK